MAAAARSAGGLEKKKYKACIIGDSKMGGYGHCIQYAFALRDDVATVALADRRKWSRTHAKRLVFSVPMQTIVKCWRRSVPIWCGGPMYSKSQGLHAGLCEQAHGFIEKPFCDDLSSGDEMVAAIEAKNLKWAIAFNFRGMPLVQHAKKLVEQGLIGTVLEPWTWQRGPPCWWRRPDCAWHVLDLMRFSWAGRQSGVLPMSPTRVMPLRQPMCRATEPLGPIVGDRVHAMYGFPNGLVGYFDSMRNPDGNGGRFGIDIYGSRAVLSIRIPHGDATVRVQWLKDSTWSDGGWKPLPDAPSVEIKDPHRERNRIITDDLIAAIEEDRRPVFSVHDGLASWEMTQAVFESCVQGGRVDIPLTSRKHPLDSRPQPAF